MSDIRLNSATPFQPMANRWPADSSQGPGPACPAPAEPSSAFEGAGSVLSLLGAGGTATDSNVFDAAPLLEVQSHAASSITDPSSTSDDLCVDARKGLKGASGANAVAKALTRATSRLGQGTRTFGSVAGLVGSAVALPGNISEAKSAIETARTSGERGDIAHASASTTTALSTGTRLAKHGVETYSLGAKALQGHLARGAGATAFKQAVPGASKAVVKAAARKAGEEALKETAEKVARRSVTAAATTAAKAGGSTLASGAGAVGRTAAKKLLTEGGEVAAKAAAKAVAKGALKTGAKAAGRFVPGLNIAIAGLDTATAVATLADPKASTGKKVTSCITAAGSIVAATNIPVVSQIGAAVSTVSSFVGSFF